MAVTLQRLADTTAKVTVDWYGDTVDVWVRPGRINRALFEEVTKADAVESLTEQVIALVDSWDILDEDGNRLPVTEEVVRDIPLGFIKAILEATVASISDQG